MYATYVNAFVARFGAIFLLCFLALASFSQAADPEIHTFSIVAFDPGTGELGVAVESKYFGVGSVVPWAEAMVGAVATQALGKVSFGPEGLRLMKAGHSPRGALDTLLASDSDPAERQVALIDAQGRTAAHTGKGCLAFAGQHEGKNYSVQGNLLAGEAVLTDMAAAYESAQKIEGSELADWLLAALKAGQAAGGDRRGQQSAALLVVRTTAVPAATTTATWICESKTIPPHRGTCASGAPSTGNSTARLLWASRGGPSFSSPRSAVAPRNALAVKLHFTFKDRAMKLRCRLLHKVAEMSAAEILEELPKVSSEARLKIYRHIVRLGTSMKSSRALSLTGRSKRDCIRWRPNLWYLWRKCAARSLDGLACLPSPTFATG